MTHLPSRRLWLRCAAAATALAMFPVRGSAAVSDAVAVDRQSFIDDMVARHAFPRDELQRVIGAAEERQSILRVMSAPPTSRPWNEFRPRYVNASRINGGVRFWQQYRPLLSRASAELGLAPEMIVATIGIETLYGRQMGNFRVIDALVTLAFGYPRRADYFRGELEQFLLMARDERMDPLAPKGSYAGAMGYAQFMPGSFRRHAIDFDGDGRIDMWKHPADPIGSVANYYRNHGWVAGEPVVVPASVSEEAAVPLIASGIEPRTPVSRLIAAGVTPLAPVDESREAALFTLQTDAGPRYWLAFANFYAITRYNRSLNYAMSVHELAREIRLAYETLS